MITRFFFVFLLIQSTLAQKPTPEKPSQKWLTLKGQSPAVIARGGFSGLFPDSSEYALQFALSTSLPGVIMFCDLQLSKDGYGFCLSGIRLENSTTIADFAPRGQKTYNVNGEQLRGWFALDYMIDDLLQKVALTQNIFTRSSYFDGTRLLAVEDITGLRSPPIFWLNVQYYNFYKQNKIDPTLYIKEALNIQKINFISSPEIGFLKNINGIVNKARTKLIFRFLEADAIEPTTKQKYSSILKDLSSIKLFASGILVPKEYIWPVNAEMYLEAPTNLVADAHMEGLEVYASGFANDIPGSYNYSYDPTTEYLQLIDNGQFSVDGLLTDFPPTASEAIACFANNKNATKSKGKALIISHNGASGVYPGSTDLAYQQAVDDGADIIDCSVQMSKDGVAFCLESPDLTGDTTALSTFMTKAATIPEIQPKSGVFSFDLTWSEIQTLKPQLKNPFAKEGLQRNPKNKNKGKLISLTEFLELSKQKAVSGILINVENAAYLASKKGLSITDAVATALSNTTFDKQSSQQVFIQSDDSSVLSKFSNVPTYKRVLSITETFSDAPKQAVEEIKKFADAVNLRKNSIIPTSNFFTRPTTSVLEDLHMANLSVYVSVFKNEFVSMAFDYLSDPMAELATFVGGYKVDGIVTEYPATASTYMRSQCADPNAKLDYGIVTSQPGDLINLIQPEALPPAEAPAPALDVSDVVDPPLPPVAKVSNDSASDAGAAPAPQKSSQTAKVANVGLSLVAIVVLSLLSLGY